jgi:hypothetical protein
MLSRLQTFASISNTLSLAEFSGETGTIICIDKARHDWIGASLETIFFHRNSYHFEKFARSDDSLILSLPQMFLEIFGMSEWNCSFFRLYQGKHGLCGQWLGKNEAEYYRDKWATPLTRELSIDDL